MVPWKHIAEEVSFECDTLSIFRVEVFVAWLENKAHMHANKAIIILAVIKDYGDALEGFQQKWASKKKQ